MKFKIGDRVRRLEERDVVTATVIAAEDGMIRVYELQYDEGGTGWWPENTIELIEAEAA